MPNGRKIAYVIRCFLGAKSPHPQDHGLNDLGPPFVVALHGFGGKLLLSRISLIYAEFLNQLRDRSWGSRV